MEQEEAMSNFTEWLLDAPLFIDKYQVSAFYDAIVRPDHTVESIDISDETLVNNLARVKGSIEGEIKAEGGVGWLAKLKASITGTIEQGQEKGWRKSRASSWKLAPVENPYRQLLHLVTHYLANSPKRIVVCSNTGGFPDNKYVVQTPRALVFMDLVPVPLADGSKKGVVLLPMAFESTGGKVITVFDKLGTEIDLKYPDPLNLDALRDYWQAYTDAFDAQRSMIELEKLLKEVDEPVQWIDYRMPIWANPDASEILAAGHLHLVARGRYDTGTFAYNFIKRGYKHGLRIVGTLKSEPDINVLAVFER